MTFVPPSRAVRRDTVHTVSLVAPHVLPGDAILDIGCGAGHVTAALATRCTDTWGIDIVDARAAEVPNFARYDGRTLDFADGRFDVVVLAFVLHHVPDEVKPVLLGEAKRVCRRAMVVVEDTPRNAVDRFFNRRHGETFRRSIGSTAAYGFYDRARWEREFAGLGLRVAVSRPLSRLCRDWLQPYARSVFVLDVGGVASVAGD